MIASTELTAYLQPSWKDLGQAYQITRERWKNDEHTVEVAYRITSLKPEQADAPRLLELDRATGGLKTACIMSATSRWARTPAA